MNTNKHEFNPPESKLMSAKYKRLAMVKMNPFLTATAVTIIYFMLLSDNVIAQNGNISGYVADAKTGNPLSSVIISVRSSEYQTITDVSGRFYLRRIPFGQHTLIADVNGYRSTELTIELDESEIELEEIRLDFDFEYGDRQLLVNPRKGLAQIYTKQLHSQVIGHTSGSGDVVRFGDFNLADGLVRMPGVQAGRMGELNLRGTGRNRFGVQLDGLPLAATNMTGRVFDLGTIPVDMIHHITIIHAPTPDIDHTGIGGIIQLKSWQPAGDRYIDVNAGGMTLSEYNILSGLGRVASVAFAERFNEKFSMTAHVSHQTEINGFESLGIDYGAVDFGDGYVDVFENVKPALHGKTRTRLAGRLQFNYKPDNFSRYYLTGISGNDNAKSERHRNIFRANNDWIDPFTTGSTGLRGIFSYNPSLTDQSTSYNIFHAGSEHQIYNMQLSFAAGVSTNEREYNHFDFLYSRDRLNYEVNRDDRFRPEMVISNINLLQDGTVDQRSMVFNNVNRFRNDQVENRYAFRTDLLAPFGPLRFRLGASALMAQSERRYEEATLSTIRTYHQIRFQKVPRSSFDVYGKYHFADFIDAGLAAKYVDVSRPDMRVTEDDMLRRSVFRNFDIDEDIYAGYMITSLDLGIIGLTGGVRAEMTRADYTGKKVLFNRFGFFDSSYDSTTSVSYLDLFPYAHISVAATPNTRLKATYSRSIERQSHEMLAPYELILSADTLRFRGNSDLKPLTSDNLDMMVEHYLSSIGVISVGFFYKRLNNLVYYAEQVIQESEFPFLNPNATDGLNIKDRRHVNSDKEIGLMGLTLNWYQHLHFLPSSIGKLSINANYSWTYSDNENKRNAEDVHLVNLSPHVYNVALMYSKNRITGQIAWHRTAPSLFKNSTLLQWAPEVKSTEMIYLDQYEDGWNDLSLFIGFRISERFRFWANVHNLLPNDRLLYGHERDAYVFDTARQNGIKIMTGIRFTY